LSIHWSGADGRLRNVQQRECRVKGDPYSSSGAVVDSSKILTDTADAEPVREEAYRFKSKFFTSI